MTLYAFDDIDDAIDATRAFLWPFDLGTWARLALVMFFVGGAGSGFNPGTQFSASAPPGDGGGMPTEPGVPADLGPEIWGIIAAVVAALLVLAILFLLVGSVMEFVFVEALRREAVTVRRHFREHWGRGLRLFGFRLVIGIVVLAVVVGLGLLAFGPAIFGSGDVSVGLVLLLIAVFALLAVVVGLVMGFTTVFVVPIMIVEECGVLAGWSRFWPTVTGQWRQYVVYAVMGFVLQIAGGIVAAIATMIPALIVLIPFAIAGFLAFGLVSVNPIAGWAVIGFLAAIYLLLVLVIALFVSVPIQSFLRYYALFVLGDTNEAFDLIPERRRAVREGDADESGAPA